MDEAGSQEIGSYTIIRLLKEDTLGRTYLGKRSGKARDKSYVVMRVFNIPLTTEELREAFLTRAKQLKKLAFRHIADTLDFKLMAQEEQKHGSCYLVTRYVQGKSARELFAAEPRPAVEVKRILSPIADALQYAHATHLIHGNLHPDAITIDEAGQLHLADFTPLPPDVLPVDAIEPAALLYMAPEQLAGQPATASDQYALAVMVYEWLCGSRPYSAIEREALLQQQREQPLPLPRSRNSAISPTIEAVLVKALSLRPEERFPHIQTFADEYLRALLGFPMGEQKAGAQRTMTMPPIPAPVKAITPSLDKPEKRENDTKATGDILEDKQNSESKNDRENEENKVVEVDEVEEVDEDDSYYRAGERPSPRKFTAKPNTHLFEDVTRDLSQGGILSQSLNGYEERSAQLEMAQLVATALADEQHALVEASTGTGKSLAYLLPIVRSGQGAIISTANKALQEQLYLKDIPFVQEHVQKFDAALIKGVGNYICLDRLNEEHKEMLDLEQNPALKRLWNIVTEFELTISGDFEELGNFQFTVPADLRSRVNVDGDLCSWAKCEFFAKCYVRAMKERAERARILVVNHTLLLLDAASGGFILPQREVIVVDEAHHLEEEATRAFTISINQGQVYALLALTRLRANSAPHLQDEARKQTLLTWLALERVANPGFKGRANLTAPLEEALKLSKDIEKLATSLEMQRPQKMSEKEEVLYDKLITRTSNLATNIRHAFSVKSPDKFVYYVEIIPQNSKQRTSPLQVSAAPLDVATLLHERLFNQTHVIATSATLATVAFKHDSQDAHGPTFDYFRKRVGLDPDLSPDVHERILPLTFDYERNALLYLPRHLPLPAYGDTDASHGYMKALADEMMLLVKASRGRAFLLFSSRRMMDAVWQEFQNRLPRHLDLNLMRQGDMSRIELVRAFRDMPGAVLFGLKSFWEGVDITGEALSLVVIDKMPFDPPDDPVYEARVALMKAQNEDWFGTYALPQAVLRLKQGLGRLLRTHEDRGVMAILDTRLHRKSYGRLVIQALPPARRTYDMRDVERFFGAGEEDAPF